MHIYTAGQVNNCLKTSGAHSSSIWRLHGPQTLPRTSLGQEVEFIWSREAEKLFQKRLTENTEFYLTFHLLSTLWHHWIKFKKNFNDRILLLSAKNTSVRCGKHVLRRNKQLFMDTWCQKGWVGDSFHKNYLMRHTASHYLLTHNIQATFNRRTPQIPQLSASRA